MEPGRAQGPATKAVPRLPPEVWTWVLMFLDGDDLRACEAVFPALMDEVFWREQLRLRFRERASAGGARAAYMHSHRESAWSSPERGDVVMTPAGFGVRVTYTYYRVPQGRYRSRSAEVEVAGVRFATVIVEFPHVGGAPLEFRRLERITHDGLVAAAN